MGVWPRLHAALAVALVPSLVAAPAVGAGVLAVWTLFARPRRPAAARDALLVLLAVVAAVALVHGRSWDAVAVPLLVAGALTVAMLRLDAGATRAAAVATGVGAAATATALAGGAVAQALAGGFGQVATATFHPNATAALALGLAASSALALRGGRLERLLGGLGVMAALALLLLTGSRGGVVGLLVASAVALAVGLGYLATRGGRPRAGWIVAGAGAVALLVATQAVLGNPARWSALLPTDALQAVDAAGDAALFERLARLADPLATSGGRVGAWNFARELVAHRPFLGYGFDAVDRVYAPAAAAELASPLAHPHHGVLTLLLQGGALFAVAVLVLAARWGGRALRAALADDVAAAVAVAALAGLVATEMLDSVARFGSVIAPLLLALLLTAAPEDDAPTDA